jgi:hypothetical protein
MLCIAGRGVVVVQIVTISPFSMRIKENVERWEFFTHIRFKDVSLANI